MSIQAVAWALQQKVEFAPKFILVCLANYADEDGECWPSQKTLAKNAGCGVRSVQRYLDVLEEAGLIQKIETEGEKGHFSTLLYRLKIHTPTVRQSDRRSNRPYANAVVSPYATGGVHEPSVEPSEEETLSLTGARVSSSCEADARSARLNGSLASAPASAQEKRGPSEGCQTDTPAWMAKRPSEMTPEERLLAKAYVEAQRNG